MVYLLVRLLALEPWIVVWLSLWGIARVHPHAFVGVWLLHPVVRLVVHVGILLVLPRGVDMALRMEHLGTLRVGRVVVAALLLVLLEQSLLSGTLGEGVVQILVVLG